MTGPEQHAATVREALEGGVPLLRAEDRKARRERADAALDELVALARDHAGDEREYETQREYADQLRAALEAFFNEWDGPFGTYAPSDATEALMRAALAGAPSGPSEADQLRAALDRVAEQQPKTIDRLRANGIVFDGPLGTDPDNWEHVAFAIYSDLCEMASIARAALDLYGHLDTTDVLADLAVIEGRS